MKSTARQLLMAAIPLVFLAGCNVAPRPMPIQAQEPVRSAAGAFVSALKNADQSRLSDLTISAPDSETRRLTQDVLSDAMVARRVQLALHDRFHRAEDRVSVVGSDAWIDQLVDSAAHGPILQAGERVRIGDAGRDGMFFLRHQNGQWKVEVVPTLVAESGGRTHLSDPVVDYRFNTTRTVNEHFLARLTSGEFTSFHDYQQAKNRFWFQYMSYAASGDDPRDKLLSDLPPLPAEQMMLAVER